MANILAGFEKNLRRFFSGIPPEYPLFWGLRKIEAFFTGDAMLSSPSGLFLWVSPPGISAKLDSTATLCYSATPLFH